MPGRHNLERFFAAVEERRSQIAYQTTSLLVDSQSVQLGDFTFSSGLKSSMKVEIDKLRSFRAGSRVDEFLVEAVKLAPGRNGNPPDVVVGVISGGVSFAEQVARMFGARFAARLGTTDTEEKRKMERGYFRQGDNVLIIEDVLTTAGNTVACADRVWQEGGIPFMVATIFDYKFSIGADMLAANNLLSVNLTDFDLLDKYLASEAQDGRFDEAELEKMRHWHDVDAPAFFAQHA